MIETVSASGENWVMQDRYWNTYTYNGHTLGKFYAVQGSPDAEGYFGDIVFKVQKTAPWNPYTWRVSSFKKEDGDSWQSCWWIFCTYYWGEVQVKTYEDYYSGSADPQWFISYAVAYRYLSGSNVPYDALDSMLKAAFDAVLSLAGSPIGGSWIFDVIGPNSDVISGLGTNKLTVNLRTGKILWNEYYDAKYGIIKDQLTLTGALNWANSHDTGYSDWINFDAKYTVEAGYIYYSPGMDTPVYVPVTTDNAIMLPIVNVRVELVPLLS
ncbi:hypothetical protein [Thermococcus waiotapuensis]|uniref:Uncharacterized protein n=1 Tax=Thermococcus waiotapuensis TaxID=90909 RepID=A0AAE4T3C6_9EURY|nr:hypothetical protein [Thermococcus waiotapuensis]MDV3103688.1 hypothetical protein [Thermococcus waiotapuensis]